jgi:hypothetical protein
VFHFETRTWVEGVSKQVFEKNITTQARESDREKKKLIMKRCTV